MSLFGPEKLEDAAKGKNPDKPTQVFSELLDKAKSDPTVNQEAARILIEQMYQISEAMSEKRDIDAFLKLQRKMRGHWAELYGMSKDSPQMREMLDAWAQKFLESKQAVMELIKGVKDNLTDQTQKMQEAWTDMQITIGKTMSLSSRFEAVINRMGSELQRDTRAQRLETKLGSLGGDWPVVGTLFSAVSGGKGGSGLANFIDKCNRLTTGFALVEEGLPDRPATNFLESINEAIREGAQDIARLSGDRKKELVESLEKLSTDTKTLSSTIKEAHKIFTGIKIIRDTKSLRGFLVGKIPVGEFKEEPGEEKAEKEAEAKDTQQKKEKGMIPPKEIGRGPEGRPQGPSGAPPSMRRPGGGFFGGGRPR